MGIGRTVRSSPQLGQPPPLLDVFLTPRRHPFKGIEARGSVFGRFPDSGMLRGVGVVRAVVDAVAEGEEGFHL